MTKIIKRYNLQAALLMAFVLLPVLLFSCKGGTIGFGDVLDFEAPYLELDQGVPDPYYLILNPHILIQGSCRDNVGVHEVICEDSEDPSIIYGKATLSNGKTRWAFEATNFNFSMQDSGKQFAVRIVAYDRAGNSAERSIVYLKISVDFRPPAFENPIIYRSERRIMNLMKLTTPDGTGLQDLELDGKDPFANRQQYSDYYQNGAFWIRADVVEEETVLVGSSIVMYIYDVNDDVQGHHVYSKVAGGTSVYAPQWLVTEGEIAAKTAPDGETYEAKLARGKRLYFRVRFVAEDIAGNKTNDRVVDFGSFCLFRDADKPKASPGGGVGINVTAGTEIPVDIFDDDTVEVAWVDLLEVKQFNAYAGASDKDKLETIKNKLMAGDTVYNWRNQGNTIHNDTSAKAIITNRVQDPATLSWPTILPESLTARVETGSEAADYGDYRLIAIIKDRKDKPHNGPAYPASRPLWGTLAADDATHWHPEWFLGVFDIIIADENAPLIVIDTVDITLPVGLGRDQYNAAAHLGRENLNPALYPLLVNETKGYDPSKPAGVYGASTGNSPEENTFPLLIVDGRYFWINGYTLDDNSKNKGKVEVFKLAWIPYWVTGTAGGQDSLAILKQVQDAMRYGGASNPYPDGVQFWELSETNLNQDWDNPNTNTYNPSSTFSYYIRGTDQKIGSPAIPYTKQTFRKRFDVLGGPDDLKPTVYKNFTRDFTKDVNDPNSTFENEPKLFVMYAQDVDNNYTFRTIRLLGNANPPNLNVYDFSLRKELLPDYDNAMVNRNQWAIIPNQDPAGQVFLQQSGFNPLNVTHQGFYYNYFYNGMLNKTQIVGGQTVKIYDANDLARPFAPYPPNTVLKFWAEASGIGGRGIRIKSIKMEDVTEKVPVTVGYVDAAAKDLTYVMPLPDREVRSFRFTAVNELNITAQLERTIAVTSTAVLMDIISPLASGDYGVTPWGTFTYKNDLGQDVQFTGWDPNKIITLQAHFSAPVRVKAGSDFIPGNFNALSYDPKVPANWKGLPVLNIRYQSDHDNNPATPPVWVYQQVPFTGKLTNGLSEPTLYLEFKWPVPTNATGRIETLDLKLYASDKTNINNSLPQPNDRPINLNGAEIQDADSHVIAFLPGGDNNYNMPNWPDHHYSLQGMTELKADGTLGPLNPYYPGKQIMLDGKVPVLLNFSAGGKRIYTPDLTNPLELTYKEGYYFNESETISFTLEASKRLRTSGNGNPRVEFEIWYPKYNPALTDDQNTAAGNIKQGTYFASYVRPAGDNGMLFSVDAATLPSGTLKLKSINTTGGGITDWVNNDLDLGADNATLFSKYGNTLVVVDKVTPGDVKPALNGSEPPAPVTGEVYTKYNVNPVLTITGTADDQAEPWGFFVEYSMDGGISWTSFPRVKDGWTMTNPPATDLIVMSGLQDLTVRQRDLAGNYSAQSKIYKLDIRTKFPEIVSISIVEPAMTYAKTYFEGNNTISFSLDFEDPVYTTNESAYIIVADRAYRDAAELADLKAIADKPTATQAEKDFYQYCLNYSKPKNKSEPIKVVQKRKVTTDPNYYSSTLYFKWDKTGAIGKQMPNGLTVRTIYLKGDIKDAYGNNGVESYKTTTEVYKTDSDTSIDGNPTSQYGWVTMYLDDTNNKAKFYRVSNVNGVGHQILTVPPTLVEATPRMVGLTLADGTTVTEANNASNIVQKDRQKIVLNFDDYVKIESGYIIIRPEGEYPIPPVIPVDSYVVTKGQDTGVYVEGFNEILNRLNDKEDPSSTSTLFPDGTTRKIKYREYLQVPGQIFALTSAGALPAVASRVILNDNNGLDLTTGQHYGPYKLSTQGLVQGAGYPADPALARAFNIDSTTSKHLSTGDETNWNVTGSSYWIPDTAAKYVLDYRYRINLTSANAVSNESTLQPVPGVPSANAANGFRPTSYVTDVANIRKALNAAEYRWQVINVMTVKISDTDPTGQKPSYLGRTITVDLDRPLPAGMKWTLTIDKDAFMDEAGNGIDQVNAGKYWFWSNGAQTPIIRVDRKSLDHRSVLDRRGLDKGDGSYDYIAAASPNPADFNKVAFRVESETPGAIIRYTVRKGADKPDAGTYTPPTPPTTDTNLLAADEYAWGASLFTAAPGTTANWTASIPNFTYTTPSPSYVFNGTANGPGNAATTVAAWGSKNGVATDYTAGGGVIGTNNVHRWIRPNLIFRAIQVSRTGQTFATGPAAGLMYDFKDNTSSGRRDGNGSVWQLRSYNRDATTTLFNITPGTAYPPANSSPGRATYPDAELVFSTSANPELKASKNYVIADATAPHAATGTGIVKLSENGYEGIFKTVVATYYGSNGTWDSGPNKSYDVTSGVQRIFGSSSLSALPSVAGFPLREASADARYMRITNNNTAVSGQNPREVYWISTDIVSTWYMQFASQQNQSSPQAACLIMHGDAGSRVSGSYGDLVFTYYQDRD